MAGPRARNFLTKGAYRGHEAGQLPTSFGFDVEKTNAGYFFGAIAARRVAR